MMVLKVRSEREQEPLDSVPFDRWLSPYGDCLCEFHRRGSGFVLRFPGEADFEIDPASHEVFAFPATGIDDDQLRKQFNNSIVPLIGNYNGGLFLHGSAVQIGGSAAAFLGLSRSGKTTLAGALGKAGYPIITEDVIELSRAKSVVEIVPNSSSLRLFYDSAEFLMDGTGPGESEDRKIDLSRHMPLTFADKAVALETIFILGDDHEASLSIEAISGAAGLPALMPHSFVLDVEDRQRLRAQFERLGDLAQDIRCFTLDYPRRYEDLEEVMERIVHVHSGAGKGS